MDVSLGVLTGDMWRCDSYERMKLHKKQYGNLPRTATYDIDTRVPPKLSEVATKYALGALDELFLKYQRNGKTFDEERSTKAFAKNLRANLVALTLEQQVFVKKQVEFEKEYEDNFIVATELTSPTPLFNNGDEEAQGNTPSDRKSNRYYRCVYGECYCLAS